MSCAQLIRKFIIICTGNAEDVTERLDKGLLDFGLLIQPADISKYDYFFLPEYVGRHHAKDIL
ncbi:MAG: hypothetical protein ACLVJ6_10595 [Merdibacter sp.]